MKFKVLAYTFSIPLLWVILLGLNDIAPGIGISRSLSTAVIIGLLIGSLIGRFLIESKYLTDIIVDGEKLSLSYLTPLARQRQITIRLSTLTGLEIKKKIFLIRDFGSITFFSRDKQVTFNLLNPDTKKVAEQLARLFQTNQL